MLARTTAVLATAAVLVVAAGGCKKKKADQERVPVPVAALGAIPADASVVVGIDVGQLAQAAVVARAIDQMLVRDPELAARLSRLATQCGVDVTHQLRSVHLALGPRSSKGPPGQISILVATGQLGEAALTRCLQAGAGGGGGQLTVREVGGRSLYKLTEGERVLFLAFGQADTVVVGPDERWVLAAVGDGPKVETSVELAPLLAQVDRSAAMWAVGMMDAELGQALTRVTHGTIKTPPRALHGSLDTRSGLAARISFTMASEGDADALTGFARDELAIMAVAAQSMGLGRVVAKVEADRKGAEARFRLALTDEEVRQVLSAIDRGQGSGQDAHPADADIPDGGHDAGTGDAAGAP